MTTTTTKKITFATVKSFIKKSNGHLYINVKSKFDGMTDGVERVNGGFTIARACDLGNCAQSNTLGIKGAWFVGSSRDYFKPYEDATFTGIEVYNSCGSFILAIQK